MNHKPTHFPRRTFLRALGLGGGAVVLSQLWPHHGALEALLGAPPARAQSGDALTLLQTVDLPQLLGRPLAHNVLKLFRAVVDPTRNRVYVSGILTPHIGIWDATAQAWVGTLDTGLANTKALKYLALDPRANRLYVRDATHDRLLAIDVATDTVLATTNVPQAVGSLVADPARGLLYMVTGQSPSFRALDGATLETVYTSDAMGQAITQAVYDEAEDALYLLEGARRGQGRIYRFALAQRAAAPVVDFTWPPNQRAGALAWDAAARRFLVSGAGALVALDERGAEVFAFPFPRELEYRAMGYDPATRQIAVLFQRRAPRNAPEAPLNGLGGRLVFFSADDGRELGALDFGHNLRSLVANPRTGDLYLPNGDASALWHVPPDRSQAIPLRLGDSLEQIVPLLGGKLLAMNSRLGGSYIMLYDPDEGALETFTDGTWPIPMRTNAQGDHLLVLNAWDSTLSVFRFTPQREHLGTVALGLPPGSSDRLPDLAVDSARGLAYAAYPEFGQIAVVDWRNMQPIARVAVEGFPAGVEEGGGPWQLQVAVNEETGTLFAFWLWERRLDVFEAQTYRLLNTVHLPPRPQGAAADFDLLFMDSARNRLFVGPLELDGTSGQPSGRQLPSSGSIFALDAQANVYWVGGSENLGAGAVNVVSVVERESLAARNTYIIGPAATLPLKYALDTQRRRLYIGDMTRVQLSVYALP